MTTGTSAWLTAGGLVLLMGVAGAVEGKAAPPPPPATWDYEVVKPKKVARHVQKILMVDPDFCIAYHMEKPRSRFVRKTSKALAAQNSWAPRSAVRKGVKRGFKAVCVL